MTPEIAKLARPYCISIVLIMGACERRAEPKNDSVTVAATPSDSATQSSRWTVDFGGLGPVRAGMTLAQLSEVAGEAVRPKYEFNEECDFVSPKFLPKGVSIMVLQDSVARVDINETGVLTKEGAGVGDTETRVLQLYGSRARVEPHHYTGPTGHYVIVQQPDDTLHRIIFETDGTKVLVYRAGRGPGVDYVEGCA